MNDFHRDDEFQRYMRDSVLKPGLYEEYAIEGRYVFIDKGRFSTLMQRRFAVDTIMQREAGRAIAIEEKIVRWPGREYTALTLETDSCTVPGKESQGWMHYGEADWLNYCLVVPSAICADMPCRAFADRCACKIQHCQGDLIVRFIEFQPLKEWFWKHHDRFPDFMMSERNRTKGKVVPIREIESATKVWMRRIFRPRDSSEGTAAA